MNNSKNQPLSPEELLQWARDLFRSAKTREYDCALRTLNRMARANVFAQCVTRNNLTGTLLSFDTFLKIRDARRKINFGFVAVLVVICGALTLFTTMAVAGCAFGALVVAFQMYLILCARFTHQALNFELYVEFVSSLYWLFLQLKGQSNGVEVEPVAVFQINHTALQHVGERMLIERLDLQVDFQTAHTHLRALGIVKQEMVSLWRDLSKKKGRLGQSEFRLV